MKKNLLLLSIIICTINSNAQNVGIGVTTPVEKLDVNGNINIAGTIKANGQAGTAGQVLMSTGAGLSWGSQSGYKHCQMYYKSSSATWKVPAGITEIMVEAWGGGGGYGDYVGGTSGSYARIVQTVTPGSSISYTIGAGGAYFGAGNNSTVSLPAGTLAALGGGAITQISSGNYYGVNSMNAAGSIAAFYMAGNRGTNTSYVYGQKSAGVYTQTTYLASGGAPVGMLNSSPNPGNIIYYENGVSIFAVITPGIPTLPSSGGCYPNAGADGMVIFWW